MEKAIELLKKYWWIIAILIFAYWYFIYRKDDTDKELLGQ